MMQKRVKHMEIMFKAQSILRLIVLIEALKKMQMRWNWEVTNDKEIIEESFLYLTWFMRLHYGMATLSVK